MNVKIFTTVAPKALSAKWSEASEKEQGEILENMLEANMWAVDHLDGAGGSFFHQTDRAGDVCLHIHNVIMNSRPRREREAQAIFANVLSRSL